MVKGVTEGHCSSCFISRYFIGEGCEFPSPIKCKLPSQSHSDHNPQCVIPVHSCISPLLYNAIVDTLSLTQGPVCLMVRMSTKIPIPSELDADLTGGKPVSQLAGEPASLKPRPCAE